MVKSIALLLLFATLSFANTIVYIYPVANEDPNEPYYAIHGTRIAIYKDYEFVGEYKFSVPGVCFKIDAADGSIYEIQILDGDLLKNMGDFMYIPGAPFEQHRYFFNCD